MGVATKALDAGVVSVYHICFGICSRTLLIRQKVQLHHVQVE